MKKVFSVILVLALALCSIGVFAEDTDSITGTWYISYVVMSGGVPSAPGDMGFAQNMLINEDGTCEFAMSDYMGNSNSVVGTWVANDSGMYDVAFDGGVRMLAQIIGDELVGCDSDGNIYHCVRSIEDTQKIIPFNSYSSDAPDTAFMGDWVCEATLHNSAKGTLDYYSRHMVGLDFTVSIGFDEVAGGYISDWHIGGVGGQEYNENLQTATSYGMDENGDVYMYTQINLSNGVSSQVFIYMDTSLEVMHVYGIYGTLVFVKAENVQERPAAIAEAYGN